MLPIIALLAGATVWGLIWYPYRFLEDARISGALATCITYGIALAASVFVFRRELWALKRVPPILILIALTAGWTNLAYVLATLHGEVMQVLLLFYLAPLWTVIFARVLLDEKPVAQGYLVMGLALAGAAVMLWRRESGLPLPRGPADWMALSSGIMFALANVLIRKTREHSIAIKSISVFAGVAVLSIGVMVVDPYPQALPPLMALPPLSWLLLVVLGIVIFAINPVVQHGLMHTPANQAIVIFLFELVVGAVASYLLADEIMTRQQWIGGAMIVAASLFSGTFGEESTARQANRA